MDGQYIKKSTELLIGNMDAPSCGRCCDGSHRHLQLQGHDQGGSTPDSAVRSVATGLVLQHLARLGQQFPGADE